MESSRVHINCSISPETIGPLLTGLSDAHKTKSDILMLWVMLF